MTIYEADVVIIGGGLCGALIAATLAETRPNLEILVIEAGASIDDRLAAVGAWASSASKGLSAPYADPLNDVYAPFPDSSANYLGDKRFKSTYLRRLGGSTWHWQGSTPRLLPSDFRMRSTYGVGIDWPLSYDVLEKWYARAERALGVSGDRAEWDGVHGAYRTTDFPMPPIWSSYSDRQLAQRIEGLEIDGRKATIRRTPQARNSQPYQDRPPCAGNSICIPICPIGAKYDATVHLRKATEHGATILDRTVAKRIRFANADIEAVELLRWSARGVEPAEARSRRGIYVLAAHAIESARLLLLSEAKDRSGQIGRNLMDHPTGQVVGLAPEAWYPFRGPPVTSGIDDWRDGAFRAHSAAWKLSLGNDGHGRFRTPEQAVSEWMRSGLIGASLRKKINEDGPRLFRMSWGSEQLPNPANTVELGVENDALGLPQVKLTYDIGDYTRAAFSTIRSSVLTIFAAADIRQAELDPDPLKYGGSGHILGTCRMAATAEQGVVDKDCRSFAYPGLFVVGGAVFPTVGTANPSLTAAALALRAAEAIAGLS
jgi:glucose dehydrogenase